VISKTGATKALQTGWVLMGQVKEGNIETYHLDLTEVGDAYVG
jgi:hypothetical protein